EPLSLTDVLLWRAAVAGRPDAVEQLMDVTMPVVYGFVLARVGGDQPAAEDLVQEALVEALRNPESFRGDALLTTWLCAIARRRVARPWERERRQEAAAAGLRPIGDAGFAAD